MASERQQMTKEVTDSLNSALDRLHKIWNEIGIVEEQRIDRMNVVMLHVRNLLDEMLREEERMKDKVLNNVKSLREQLDVLSKELLAQPFEPQPGASILHLERELRSRVDKLAMEKNDRLKKLRKLRGEDQHLCDVLQREPYYIPSNSIPSKEQLQSLENHIQELHKEKTRRYQIFKTTKANIVKFMDDLEQAAETSFEREIIHEEDSFQLSHTQLKALKEWHDQLEQKTQNNFALAKNLRERVEQLWERLEVTDEEKSRFTTKSTGYKPTTIKILKAEISRLEAIMMENMQKVIESTRKELIQWWDKCYISDNQRRKFRPFFEDDFTEEALRAHDQEVSRVKQYYRENEEMLTKVSRRQKLWNEFLELERKASDPNRLFNRGCNLLKEEKARKKMKKELPKVEEEVREQVEEWERENNREFLIDGCRFVDYITRQWLEYNDTKEKEKAQRHEAKAKETEQEMLYGSRPPSAKRRMVPGNTPTKTPNKIRKMNDTQKTPGSVSRLGRTTMYSPMCMPPRSASKTDSRRENLTPYRNTTTRQVTPGVPYSKTPMRSVRRRSVSQPNLSQTPLSAKSSHGNTTRRRSWKHKKMPTAGTPGKERKMFHSEDQQAQRGLNPRDRPNCRSSVVPRPTMYL